MHLNFDKEPVMKIHSYAYSAVIAALLFLTGCASTGSTAGKSEQADSNTIEVHDPSLTLADYIRRAGGLSVHNVEGRTNIRIRGNLSFNSTSDPLFVVDGVRFGNDYDRVEYLVPLNSIQSIQVIKGSEASSLFGMAASSGAIIITTKRR